MKSLTLLTALATLLTFNSIAQTGREEVTILATGTIFGQYGSTTMGFSLQGSNQFDGNDSSTIAPTSLPTANQTSVGDSMTPLLLTPGISLYTMSSDSALINHFDARPEFDRSTSFSFGIWSRFADTLTISAQTWWTNDPSDSSSNATVNYVYLEEISTGNFYELLHQNTTIIVPAGMLMLMDYSLHIVAQPLLTTADPVCYGSNTGSITLHNPNCSQWDYVVYQNGNPVQSATVSNPDTVITSLVADVYEVVVHSNNLLVDSEDVALYDPVPVVAEFSSTGTLTQVQFANESWNAVSYAWTFGDSAASTDVSPLHTYPGAGNYDVTLTASDANGCSSSVTHTVSVYSSVAYHGPNFLLIDPNGNQANTEAQRNASDNFEVYAADGILTITMDVVNEGNYTATVYNLNGELISSENYTAEKGKAVFQLNNTISVSGIYLVTITGNGNQFTKRLFIQK